jgi:hypothetical protein
MTPAGDKLDRRLGEMIAELNAAQPKDKRMSVLDKADIVNERHADFEKALDDDLQKLLERYDALDEKKKKVLDRRHLALSERDKKFDEMDAALDRLSNLGNSASSNGSSAG